MSDAVVDCSVPEGIEKPAGQDASNMEEAVEVEEIEENSTQDSSVPNGEVMPALEVPNLDEEDSRGSTPSEGNTPRDYDTSSSSASPVPDEGFEVPKRKVNLGRDISLMMQALNSLHSPEEKLAALCKKYADLLEQQKVKDKRLRGLERKLLQAAREKDQVQKELNKAVLGKSRMESLARELNKQNKLLKEETYNLTVNHSKEREQVSAKFQAATDEISGKINAIADRNEVLNDQNKEMSDKIAKLLEETVAREKMVKKMMEQRDLQEQILELKLKKAEEEREAAIEDGKLLKGELEKTAELSENQEKELKAQIAFYSKKVAMFQSTLDKSNQVFSTFRSEMDGMSKKVKTLEKATESWKRGYEKSNAENLKLQADIAAKADTITRLNTKVEKLTKLSRALQVERNELSKLSVQTPSKSVQATKAEPTSTVNDPSSTNEVKGEPDGEESPSSSREVVGNEEALHTPQDGTEISDNNVSTTTSSEQVCDANQSQAACDISEDVASQGSTETRNELEQQGDLNSLERPLVEVSPVKAEADSTSEASVQEPAAENISTTVTEACSSHE